MTMLYLAGYFKAGFLGYIPNPLPLKVSVQFVEEHEVPHAGIRKLGIFVVI